MIPNKRTHYFSSIANGLAAIAVWPFPVFLGILALRVLFALHYRVDSDEPQHLHVVWGWANGLLPYKDFFDNHSPLFHLIYSPLLAIIGEQPDAIPLMRLAVIPCFFLTLWATFKIAKTLFSESQALWASLALGLFPPFFRCSTEFRSDDLWMALWMMFVGITLGSPTTPLFGFLAGILLGATFAASMKTALLSLCSLGALALGRLLLGSLFFKGRSRRELLAYGACLLAGAMVFPGAVVAFFAAHGALPELDYYLIGFNAMPHLGRWSQSSAWVQWGLFAALVLPSCFLARMLRDSCPDQRQGSKRAYLFLTAILYFAALRCFWPLLDAEHDLPFYPMLFAVVIPLLVPETGPIPAKLSLPFFPRNAAVTLLLLGEFARLLASGILAQNRTRGSQELIAEVLRLTTPEDTVMDLKGESVFRERGVWNVYEGITLERLKKKAIPDDAPEQLIANHTCVAAPDNFRFHARGRSFLNANYLSVGSLRVAGKRWVHQPDGSWTVDLALPAVYALVGDPATPEGLLDGSPYTQPRFLAAGPHRFVTGNKRLKKLAILWNRAAERGFVPQKL